MQRHKWVIAMALALGTPVLLAANVGFLNDTALSYLSDADVKLQNETAIRVLEDADPAASREWKNPVSGYRGRIDGLGNLKSDDGLHCRKLRLWAEAKGIESQFTFPVCKSAAGEWFIASGKVLTKVR